MPNRIIREGMLSSERIAALGWPEEVFYRRLMHIVDDYGRTEANPQYLRSRCYPLQTDTVRIADITRWTAACQKAGLILDYVVDGKRYIELLRFGQKTRTPSKCPSPPDVASKCQQMLANAGLDVCVDVSVVEGVGVSDKPRGKPRKTTIPADFAISARVRTWAQDKGHTRLDERFERFVSAARAKGYEYVDWDEALMTAVRDDWAKFGAAPDQKPGGGRRAL